MAQHLEVVEGGRAERVWPELVCEARTVAREEPSLASLLNAVIIRHSDLAASLSYQLARKLGD
ncbi:MAG: cysE, partial [Caulobacteraceae bacterium]|nr:cysE [Caulobacteraceae bacterium]